LILDPRSEVWDILTGIALTSEDEGSLLLPIIRIHLEEVFEELYELVPGLFQGSEQGFSVAEPGTYWLIDVKHISQVEPGALGVPSDDKIIVGGAISSDVQGTVFGKEPKHTGSAWSSIDPDDERSGCVSV
jgi:hypothetical protein